MSSRHTPASRPPQLPSPTVYAPSTHTTHIPSTHFTGILPQTHSYLLSPHSVVVLEAALDRATEVLIEGLRGRVFVDSGGGMNDGTVVGGGDEVFQLQRESVREKEEVKIRLASLLPGLVRWSQLALNGLPNELVDAGVTSADRAEITKVPHHFVCVWAVWMGCWRP
ncbi:hypothetical protein BV22DRAFT_1051881 [Leucogyrophana mollusca]|uniref:Uncharacterized protein n=1 Tax=Leucogyrophana mollusca TaxID=85980 RepID=A0ACB8AY97_9AGAM|nr:hypothetical protein BV22DRAFT_1051881 [Leucogyrophana mollusca]